MEILEFIDYELDRETQINIAIADHTLVPRLINPHPDAIRIMVKKNPYLFRKIKQTKETRLAAAETNIRTIFTMENLPDDEKDHFFDLFGFKIVEMTQNPTRYIQEKTIENGAVVWITSLTRIDDDLQVRLVKNDPQAIAWINAPCIDAMDYAIGKDPFLFEIVWNRISDVHPISDLSKETIDALMKEGYIEIVDGDYKAKGYGK